MAINFNSPDLIASIDFLQVIRALVSWAGIAGGTSKDR